MNEHHDDATTPNDGRRPAVSDAWTRIAIPLSAGALAQHFGHCESFALVDVDADGAIVSRQDTAAPEHQPGLLPRWLADRGADVILAGGMGSRARELFDACGVRVVVGVRRGRPDELVGEYLAGTLETGSNACDH